VRRLSQSGLIVVHRNLIRNISLLNYSRLSKQSIGRIRHNFQSDKLYVVKSTLFSLTWFSIGIISSNISSSLLILTNPSFIPHINSTKQYFNVPAQTNTQKVSTGFQRDHKYIEWVRQPGQKKLWPFEDQISADDALLFTNRLIE